MKTMQGRIIPIAFAAVDEQEPLKHTKATTQM